MAFVPDFTTSQVLGQPSQIVITDAHTGTDAAVVGARVQVVDSAGNYLVVTGNTNNYSTWATISSPLTLALLTKDTAVYITVNYVNISGVTLYTKTLLRGFTLYATTYYLFIIKAQSSRPNLVDKANFYDNEIKLLCAIQEAATAITYNDILSCQAALNRANLLINSPSNFF